MQGKVSYLNVFTYTPIHTGTTRTRENESKVNSIDEFKVNPTDEFEFLYPSRGIASKEKEEKNESVVVLLSISLVETTSRLDKTRKDRAGHNQTGLDSKIGEEGRIPHAKIWKQKYFLPEERREKKRP